MKLETHEGELDAPLTTESFGAVVACLTDPQEAFVVLVDAPELYLQAAGTVSSGFIVEYRDGGPGDHYRADGLVSAVDLVVLFLAYWRREREWKSLIGWHRVRVDLEAPAT